MIDSKARDDGGTSAMRRPRDARSSILPQGDKFSTTGLRGWTDAGAGNDSRLMPLLATCSTFHRRRPFLPIAAAWLLGVAAVVRAHAGALAWTVEIAPAGELFPVLDLSQKPPESTAAPGGNGLVIVRVHGDDSPRHLRLEVNIAGLNAPAVVEADLEQRGTVELRPRLDWDTGYLRALHAPQRQSMRISLESSGHPVQTRDVDVRVHPLDDALYFVREGKDHIDLGWVFAAYVNPEDPVVEEVATSARSFDDAFDGPAVTADERERKALAIWSALVRHGLRYAAGDPALSRGPAVYSQRVRLLGDVWSERRANCLDGSVLIASVFERIGIPTLIVLVPGHAFVGYRADKDRVEFLETTLLGEHVHSRDGDPMKAEKDALAIAANFDAARNAGRARWRHVSTRFDRQHGPDYTLIDIGTARSYGIIPLGAHGDHARGGKRTDRAAAALSRESSPQ